MKKYFVVLVLSAVWMFCNTSSTERTQQPETKAVEAFDQKS